MLGIGFETTAPTIAASLLQAQAEGLANYYVFSMHKLTPPAMRGILDAGEVRVDSVLGPGHVTSITGWHAWDFLTNDYNIPCAVSRIRAVGYPAGGARHLSRAPGRLASQGGQHLLARRQRRRQRRRATDDGQGIPDRHGHVARARRVARERSRSAGGVRRPRRPPRVRCKPSSERVFAQRRAKGLSLRRRAARHHRAPRMCVVQARSARRLRPIGPCMVSAEGACAAHYRYGGSLD